MKKLIDSLQESDVDKAESYLTFLLYKKNLLKDDLVKLSDEATYTKEDDIIDDVLEKK
ncbi:hypothetical protein V4762_06720 [Thermodesulfobium sp. 4217-1]|uniref:hypothetical protein n=1 Tax=Thermodesulfobium sp. 4217-1 TaxID=3120013 RepID=UPI003221882B